MSNRQTQIAFAGFLAIALGLGALNSWQLGAGTEVLPADVAFCADDCPEDPSADALLDAVDLARAADQNVCALPADWVATYRDSPDTQAAITRATRDMPVAVAYLDTGASVSHDIPGRTWFGQLPDARQLERQTCVAPIVSDPQLIMAYLAIAWLILNLGVRQWRRRKAGGA